MICSEANLWERQTIPNQDNIKDAVVTAEFNIETHGSLRQCKFDWKLLKFEETERVCIWCGLRGLEFTSVRARCHWFDIWIQCSGPLPPNGRHAFFDPKFWSIEAFAFLSMSIYNTQCLLTPFFFFLCLLHGHAETNNVICHNQTGIHRP